MSPTVTTWSLELTDPEHLTPPQRPPSRVLRVERSSGPGTSERLYRAVGTGWQWTDRAGWAAENWADWESRVETHVAYADGVEAGYVELDPAGLRDRSRSPTSACSPGSRVRASAATC